MTEHQDILKTAPKTGDKMVEKLFHNQLPDPDSRVLIPGCGSGNLIAAINRYCNTHSTAFPAITAIDINNIVLEEAKDRFTDREIFSHIDFLNRDFLLNVSDLGHFDYIVGNPPYMNWETIPESKQEAYAYRFETIARGEPRSIADMYMTFFEQSLRLFKDTGRLVFVTPDDFTEPSSTPSPLAEILQDYTVEFEPLPVNFPDIDLSTVITTVTQRADSAPRYRERKLDWGEELDKLLQDHDITARDIMTPDPVTYAPSDQVLRAALNMIREDFNTIPVVAPDTGDCVGYIRRRDVHRASKGTVEEYMQTNPGNHTITEEAEFGEVLRELAGYRFSLVGVDHSLDGIITRFDLNRPPVYFHLYSKIAQLEVGFRKALRDRDVKCIEHLKGTRTIQKRYRNYRDVVPDAFACAGLSDLINIADSSGLLQELRSGMSIPREVNIWDLNTLRTHIAHYYPIIHTMEEFVESDSQRTAYKLQVEYDLLTTYLNRLESSLS